MNKFIITKYQGKILSAIWENDDIVELSCEEEEHRSSLGNIYVGLVENIVKNINAAFIRFTQEQTGYYALDEKQPPFILNKKNTPKICIGDRILVQVEKENIKTKAPVLTSKLHLAGKYMVLTVGNTALSISSKITDQEWKDRCKENLWEYPTTEYGFIVRTNAYSLSMKELKEEAKKLAQDYQKIKEKAFSCPVCSLLYQAPSGFLLSLRNLNQIGLSAILTDDRSLHSEIKRFLEEEQPEDLKKLIFYEDAQMPLKNLYHLEKTVKSALSERVWLKSGGYLIIQPTEALTVIDVNTGKCIDKKEKGEHIFKINLEAAKEIGKQLRLRNLSGIIIVDFISMNQKQMQKKLLFEFEEVLKRDPIKTILVGMTNLELVELTRKKIKKPFYESWRF